MCVFAYGLRVCLRSDRTASSLLKTGVCERVCVCLCVWLCVCARVCLGLYGQDCIFLANNWCACLLMVISDRTASS